MGGGRGERAGRLCADERGELTQADPARLVEAPSGFMCCRRHVSSHVADARCAVCSARISFLRACASPCARACAGADLDNEGGEAEWAGNIISRCGNGRRDESETCDDGNIQDGDGCDRHCHLEIPRGCESRFDRLSWQKWANHSQAFIDGIDGTRWAPPGSTVKFYGEPESSAGAGQLVDWKHPQNVLCQG